MRVFLRSTTPRFFSSPFFSPSPTWWIFFQGPPPPPPPPFPLLGSHSLCAPILVYPGQLSHGFFCLPPRIFPLSFLSCPTIFLWSAAHLLDVLLCNQAMASLCLGLEYQVPSTPLFFPVLFLTRTPSCFFVGFPDPPPFLIFFIELLSCGSLDAFLCSRMFFHPNESLVFPQFVPGQSFLSSVFFCGFSGSD